MLSQDFTFTEQELSQIELVYSLLTLLNRRYKWQL